MEKAALDLDAITATARLEASEGDASTERRHHPHEQGQRDEPDNDKSDEAVAEKREARVGEHFCNGSASLARHLRDEVGDLREHADDADDDENQRRAVRKPGEDELAVGYAVLEGDAPRVDLAPGEYAAHVVPHLSRRIEHVAEAARASASRKGAPDGRRLASRTRSARSASASVLRKNGTDTALFDAPPAVSICTVHTPNTRWRSEAV